MIRGLRLWHRRWVVLLAIALPILLFLALRGRPVVPTLDELPGASESSDPPPSEVTTR